MTVAIHQIPLGIANCYLIRDEGTVLVDGGPPKNIRKFLKTLSSLAIEPLEISLILLTHCHWDHIGSAAEIKTLTGAKLAIHRNGRDFMEKEELKMAAAKATCLWGRLMRATTVRLATAIASYPRTTVDLVLGDCEFPLSDYGIDGSVIYTPGHSSDSVSLLLGTGDAFVGDLAMNGLPMRIGEGIPIFADDVGVVRGSWRMLIDMGAKMFYPAHGKPFSADRLKGRV
jgi:glyoxylase-like metal-dependent hydrolase (beta-lactamase superfamily II)